MSLQSQALYTGWARDVIAPSQDDEAVAAELPDVAAELAAYFEHQYIGAKFGGRTQFAVIE